MKNLPLVTILIPTYNRPEKLQLAIRSVLSQKYKNFVLRISDNGSDEQTKSICEEFIKSDNRIIYERNIKNIGAMANFNKLIDSVETKYYCLLSDDDFLFDNFLEDNIIALESNMNIMFSCSNCLIIDERRNLNHCQTLDWSKGLYKPSSTIIRKMAKSCFTSTAVIFRTEVREILDGFQKLGDDSIELFKLCAAFEFYVTASYGAAFTISQDSYTSSGGIGAQSSLSKLCAGLLSDLEFVKNNVEEQEQTVVTLIIVMRYMNYFSKRHLMWVLNGNNLETEEKDLFKIDVYRKKSLIKKIITNFLLILPKNILKLVFSIYPIFSRHKFHYKDSDISLGKNKDFSCDKIFDIKNWNL